MPRLEEGATSAPLSRANDLTPPPEPQSPIQTKSTDSYKTFRLSGLPAQSSEQQLKELVRSALSCYDEHVSVVSNASDRVVRDEMIASWAIEQEYGINLDQFQAWNPINDDDCTTLWPDYAYCVFGPEI